jgi:transcription-repair coupling factor (superfamily II helicase)
MKDMADELLKLYAERKTAVGHAFPPGNEWFREFEDAFEFNETEDQAQPSKTSFATWNPRSPWTACSAAT